MLKREQKVPVALLSAEKLSNIIQNITVSGEPDLTTSFLKERLATAISALNNFQTPPTGSLLSLQPEDYYAQVLFPFPDAPNHSLTLELPLETLQLLD